MVDIRKLPNDEPDPRDAEMESMRAELKGLTTLVRNVLAEREVTPVSATKPEPPALEPVADERARILAAWAAEPKVAIFIAPDENDRRASNELVARGLRPEFPPQIFKVNGVELAVAKGKSVTVPESIGALYEYMLNPWESQHKLPPLTFDQVEARMA